MQLTTYDITLLEPLLLSSIDGDPNSSVSFPFIPGSVLRGAMIGLYLKANKPSKITEGEAGKLFFSSETQFLNGYRLMPDADQRSWPLPLSLRREKPQTEKEAEFTAYDIAIKPVEPPEQKVSRMSGFGLLDSQGHLAQIGRRLSTHIMRDRDAGRSTRDSGEIYNYDALAVGQTFRAHVLSSLTPTQLAPLVELIDGELHLGGSRSAGYGRIRLTKLPKPPTYSDWLAARSLPMQTNRLIITLLSDLLLRDENGGWSMDVAYLAKRLDVQLEDAFPAFRPIGGFNRTWGVPLPQRMAFQMGTVLVCKIPEASKLNALEKVVVEGFGESREDGFGRIALNWQRQPAFTMNKPKPQGNPVMIQESSSRLMAQRIVERIWREQLETAVVQHANQISQAQTKISKSQLYRLRLAVQAGLRDLLQAQAKAKMPQAEESPKEEKPPKEKSLEEVTVEVRNELQAYLKDVQKRRSTRVQFERTRVNYSDKPRFLPWLEMRLAQTKTSMEKEPAQPFHNVLPSRVNIGGVEPAWSEALVLEMNLRLIDAVLSQMAKKSSQKREVAHV